MTSPPQCFGKSWDPKDKLCAGGLDPLYVNPISHTQVRDRCQFYSSCAARTTAEMQSKQASTPQLVSPASLVRPPGQFQPPSLVPPVQQTQPVYRPPVPYPQYQQPQQYVPQHSLQQPGMQVLGYLSVPEPVDWAVPWWLRMIREMIRSAFKGMLHSGAHFFDHNPFTKKPPGQ